MFVNGNIAPSGFEGSWASSTFTSNSGASGFLNDFFSGQSSGTVLAYLTYLIYDEEFNLIEDASGILHAEHDLSVENLGIIDLVIPKNGYIYIFIANESPTDVYFDNLQILHKKSNVLELNDYYPYGLLNTQNSQTSLSMAPDNLHKYQNKEDQTALGLNMLDFGLRHYDATLGRWHVQDPMMQFFNPYLAMNNNPVITIDPTGGIGFAGNGSKPGKPEEDTQSSGGGRAKIDIDSFGGGGSAWATERDEDGNLQYVRDEDGNKVYNNDYVYNIMYSLSGKSTLGNFDFYQSFVNGQSTGIFANRTDAEISFGLSANPGSTLSGWSHDDENINPILTNDGKGGGVQHMQIDDSNGKKIWSNWSGEYDPSQNNESYTGMGLSLGSFIFAGAAEIMFSEFFGTWMGKDGKIRSQSWGGNQYTGGKNKFAKSMAGKIQVGGAVVGSIGIVNTIFSWQNKKISHTQFGADLLMGGVGFIGLPGAIISTSYEAGKIWGPSTWFNNSSNYECVLCPK